MNGQLNDYKSGYKQCLIDIENLIDKQLLEMEKEQKYKFADEYCYAVISGCNLTPEQYENEIQGGNK
jgi:hypothetical protein